MPATVSSIVVVELMFTITCPCDVVKVKVLPLIDAIVPLAPRRWNCVDIVVSVDGGVAVVVGVVDGDTVDVAGEDALEQAPAVNDKAVAKTRLIPDSVIFLIFVFIFYSLLENIME